MTPAVEFRGLCKSFNGVDANADIYLKIRKGSIHAIIGENGAGKSTAMKILYGTYQPDRGEIWVNGQLWGGRMRPWSSPSDAIHSGIGMVHQHFMLAGPYTVLDNIILGNEDSSSSLFWLPKFLRPVDRAFARKKLEKISQQYGLSVDLDAQVEHLAVGVQQRIEILKLLYRNAEVLILDEPTAVLTPQETQELFAHLKKLCHLGKTVIIITHKLKEVMGLANRVTVFRAGRVVGEREVEDTHVEDLATLMVGRKVNLKADVPPQRKLGAPVLELSGVSLKGHRDLSDLNLKVREGEIVGISGVEGNGQSELLQLLLHPLDYSEKIRGKIEVCGKDIRGLATDLIKDLGVGVIPEDRHRDGLLLNRSVSENFLLGIQRKKPFCQTGFLRAKKLEEASASAIQEYDIRPPLTDTVVRYLSGGNQQKLIIAREFHYSPRFLIASQPTRGVDVGAIESIHKRIFKARSEGSGVLLISSELEEILALSDRIIVMYEGKFVAEFVRGQVSETVLGLSMGGAEGLTPKQHENLENTICKGTEDEILIENQ